MKCIILCDNFNALKDQRSIPLSSFTTFQKITNMNDYFRPGHSGLRVGFGSGPFGSGSFGSKSLGPDRVISNFRFRVGSGRAGSGSGRVLDS